MMEYEVVIGLEVHVELATRSKIFCGCSTEFGGEPNSHVCPVCLGIPGSLPVLNKRVADFAIKAGLALHCDIQRNNRFDRKNYFYPDLPKDYQISQLYHPICRGGYLDVKADGKERRITLCEIHMEEDAGKLIHDKSGTLIDYNRCGVPLIEIVTNPDFRSAAEVIEFLVRLQELLKYLGVSDCKMQEGSMRADVNLSVRKTGTDGFGTRTEMKNLNSFKAIQRAIEYESHRQITLLSEGGRVTQETRRWDDEAGESIAMRSKENAQDYRYFPDPDLLPLVISEAWMMKIKEEIPELPAQKRLRYCKELGIAADKAAFIAGVKELAALFEDAAKICGDASEAANAVVIEVLRLLKETGTEAEQIPLSGEQLGTILKLVREGKISRQGSRVLIEKAFKEKIDPLAYAQDNGILITEDLAVIERLAENMLKAYPRSVADYKEGKMKALDFLVGKCMAEVKGKGRPETVSRVLKERISGMTEAVLDNSSCTVSAANQKKSVESKQTVKSGRKGDRLKNPSSAVRVVNAGRDTGLEAAPQEVHRTGFDNRYRSMSCAELSLKAVGTCARLAGWVDTIRNHGGIAFVDLRDHYGVSQVVVTEEQAEGLHKEMVISVEGQVVRRDEETVNPNIPTGDVEVKCRSIDILGNSLRSLPFEIGSSAQTREDVRLKYRFLDLRNTTVHNNIVLRSQIIRFLRRQMESMGFLEIQTPILANSSPEGARDYLVPSRKHKGKFYALPQAPQQFKQLLMVSGFDRYFQIAPCFRDEDARQDRSPGEFYQLDFEMAFATQEDVFVVAEQVLYETFKQFTDKEISKPPFVRIPYEQAMLKYGTDKPDLRNPLEVCDLTGFFQNVDFKPFQGKLVRGIKVPGAGKMSKSWFASMEKFALSIGMKGLGYITVKEDGSYKGPIDKFFTQEQREEIGTILDLRANDVLYFISAEKQHAAEFAGKIRTELGKRLGLIDMNRFEFCYITDFPMYEINEESGRIDFTHNPFSMPQGEMEALLHMEPLDIKAYQYDIVCNGVELSSGAVRNHRPDVMVKAFEIAGYSEETVKEKFGALYNAFQYGAPPHAGMAPGVDRIVMLLTGQESIREVIAFPLNGNAQDLLFDSPGAVDEKQLREVHIKIR